MVNCCEAGAAEPRGDMLARWHAAKQARRSREGARGQGDKWARGRGSASGGGWQQEVGARRCRDRGGKGRGGRVADASLPARRSRVGELLAWGNAAKQRQKVGPSILGRPGGRAGMLDPTRDRLGRHAVPTLPEMQRTARGAVPTFSFCRRRGVPWRWGRRFRSSCPQGRHRCPSARRRGVS